DNNFLRAGLLLDRCPEELRHWEWYHVHRLCPGELISLHGHKRPVLKVGFSSDGKCLASVSDQTVRVWDLSTSRETLAIRPGGGTNLAFSALSQDCKQFACCTPVGDVHDGRSAGSEI